MINLQATSEKLKESFDSVEAWCNDMYDTCFAQYFNDSRSLFLKLQSDDQPITDKELSWILVQLPINLFDVAEQLNVFRVRLETLKLKVKYEQTEDNLTDDGLTVLEQKLLATAYEAVITRVENEISFSRELIMGAKKVWDGRRRGEDSMPVSEHSVELPDYVAKED